MSLFPVFFYVIVLPLTGKPEMFDRTKLVLHYLCLTGNCSSIMRTFMEPPHAVMPFQTKWTVLMRGGLWALCALRASLPLSFCLFSLITEMVLQKQSNINRRLAIADFFFSLKNCSLCQFLTTATTVYNFISILQALWPHCDIWHRQFVCRHHGFCQGC